MVLRCDEQAGVSHLDPRCLEPLRKTGIEGYFGGKGKGLTFLLHGPPGVGKTMLAECLSEEKERPLYRVNLGRLVSDRQWESKIKEIF